MLPVLETLRPTVQPVVLAPSTQNILVPTHVGDLFWRKIVQPSTTCWSSLSLCSAPFLSKSCSGNCNGKAGYFKKICPASGDPEYPTCCHVDGTKAAKSSSCKCGTNNCWKDQLCTAVTNTCKYPTCGTTDGSAPNTEHCECGSNTCFSGQTCKAATNTCTYMYPVCSTTDGSAEKTNDGPCKCGGSKCFSEGDTCTALTSTCAPKQKPNCATDKVVDAACLCMVQGNKQTAYKGQICTGDGKVVWPDCTTSDDIAALDRGCLCSENTQGNEICRVGQKCHLDGSHKGQCECVPSSTIVCLSRVPAQTTCPLTCNGHTNLGAQGLLMDTCMQVSNSMTSMYSIKNNQMIATSYSGSDCKTVLTESVYLKEGCDDGNMYIELPEGSGSSTGGGKTPSGSTPSGPSASGSSSPPGSSASASGGVTGGTARRATPMVLVIGLLASITIIRW